MPGFENFQQVPVTYALDLVSGRDKGRARWICWEEFRVKAPERYLYLYLHVECAIRDASCTDPEGASELVAAYDGVTNCRH